MPVTGAAAIKAAIAKCVVIPCAGAALIAGGGAAGYKIAKNEVRAERSVKKHRAKRTIARPAPEVSLVAGPCILAPNEPLNMPATLPPMLASFQPPIVVYAPAPGRGVDEPIDVPEPTAIALFAAGVLLVMWRRRRVT